MKLKFSDTATVGKLSLGLLVHGVVMAASAVIWFDHKLIKLETLEKSQTEMKQMAEKQQLEITSEVRKIDTEGTQVWKNTHPLEGENARRVEARLDRIEDKMDALSISVTKAINRRPS
jgi:cell division protein FtsL